MSIPVGGPKLPQGSGGGGESHTSAAVTAAVVATAAIAATGSFAADVLLLWSCLFAAAAVLKEEVCDLVFAAAPAAPGKCRRVKCTGCREASGAAANFAARWWLYTGSTTAVGPRNAD